MAKSSKLLTIMKIVTALVFVAAVLGFAARMNNRAERDLSGVPDALSSTVRGGACSLTVQRTRIVSGTKRRLRGRRSGCAGKILSGRSACLQTLRDGLSAYISRFISTGKTPGKNSRL